MPTIKVSAGAARGLDDFATLFDRGCDRLFHHDVDATVNAGQRDIAMEVGRRRNRDRIDIALDQFADIGNSDAAQRTGDEFGLFAIRVSDPNEFGARQAGEYTSMIAAHDANADDTHTQRTFRACCCSLHHVSMISPRPTTSATDPLAWHCAAGDYPSYIEVNTF